MKYKNITLILVFAFLFIGATLPDFDLSDKKINKSFNASKGDKLELDLEIGADIKILGWDKNEVRIDAILKGDDAEDVNIEFNQSGNEIIVHAEYDGSDNYYDLDGKFTVNLPNKFNIKFGTMGGDVYIKDVSGNLTGRTMGGDLNLFNLGGELQFTTMGGDIELKDSDVDGRVKTMGGDVSVENVTGNVDAKSMGGNIRQRNVKRRDGQSTGNEVNIETMGGDIDVDEATFGAKVKTMGGDITVNSAEKFVDAHTMGGDVIIKAVDGWVKAKTMGGDVEVKYVGDPQSDERDITITSMGGDIKVYLPANFSMDLDLEIKYDRKHEDDVEITSDFDFELEESSDWDRSNGRKYKYLFGKGELSGAKNKIKIHTINGKIHLIQS
jgi:DUF4097 and DUF4098 domain-containing protein YvlB